MRSSTGEDYGSYARVERERRFLLKGLPPEFALTSEHLQITDNYITDARLRLRKIRAPATRARVWELTQKFAPAPGDFARAVVTTIYLSEYEYEIFSVFEGNELRKNRYPYTHAGRAYAVDVFLGDLRGLILAATSFATDAEMEGFVMPSFAALEVTNDAMFTGSTLVDMTVDKIRDALRERNGGQNKTE